MPSSFIWLYNEQASPLLTQAELGAVQQVTEKRVSTSLHGFFDDSNVVAIVDRDEVRSIFEHKHPWLHGLQVVGKSH